MIVSFILAIAVVALDQISKYFCYGIYGKSIIGNILWIDSTLNTGVAFSMFSGAQVVFLLISSLASIIMIYLLISKKFLKNKFEKNMVGLILGGTVGNLIDRIVYGGVRDFIYLKFINFAIFNVADMFICVGVFLLLIYILVSMLKKDKSNGTE